MLYIHSAAEDLCMQDFRKVIASSLSILLTVIILSLCLLIPTSKFAHNYDWQLRENLKGSLDFLIIGASHGQCALYTHDIDQKLGTNSYNLSYDSMRNFEKKYLLEKELNRNRIDTIVLELSYDTLKNGNRTPYTDANIFSINRMDSFIDKLNYYINYVNLKNKFYVYSSWAINGMLGFKNSILQKEIIIENNILDKKGSRLLPSQDHSLNSNNLYDEHNKDSIFPADFNSDTIKGFEELIELAKSKARRVIVAVVPVSDNYIWCTDGLDEVTQYQKDMCIKHNVEYYDFNLLKDRYNLFSDIDCYSTDAHHMSGKGSKIFSKYFADFIKEASNGVNMSHYFYYNFDQLEKDSPYAEK